MALISLIKNRIKNKPIVAMNFVLLAIATTMLIYSVCNIIDDYGKFSQSLDNVIYISVDEAMPVAEISAKIASLSDKLKVKYIDYMLDDEIMLLHREYVGKDFLHNITLNDSEYQIVLSEKYKKKYRYGETFHYGGNDYVVVNFVDGGLSYCSKKGIENCKVSAMAVEMTNIKTAAEKDKAIDVYGEIFLGATYDFGQSDEFEMGSLLNANMFFALACIIIVLGFPFLENIKKESKAFAMTGYSKKKIVAIAICYQLAMSAMCLGIGIAINAIISKTLGRNIGIILLVALMLVAANMTTVAIQLAMKKRKIK